MTFNSRLFTESDAPLWTTWVEGHPESTLFHTLSWINVFKDLGMTNKSLLFFNANDLVGVLPLVSLKLGPIEQGFSLPFSTVSPLIKKGITLPESLLLDPFKKHFDAVDLHGDTPYLASSTWDLNKILKLDLTANEDILFANLPKTLRYEIRKSEKSPFQILEATTTSHLQDAWNLYESTMKRNQSGGTYWENLFTKIFSFSSSSRRILLAYLDQKPIALNIFLKEKTKAHYFAAASDAAHHALLANPKLMWENILWAKKAEATLLELGGGLTPQGSDSLYEYKKKWGTPANEYRLKLSFGFKGKALSLVNALMTDSIKRNLKRFLSP